MKRILFLIITLLSSVMAVTAQEVLIVKMKDGRVLSFPNGIEYTDISFWGTATKGEEQAEFMASDESSQWQPACEELHVSDYSHVSGQYAVAIAWPLVRGVPRCARMGICIGREPNVSAENCDSIYYPAYNPNYPTANDLLAEALFPRSAEHPYCCYTLLGDSLTFFKGNNDSGKRQWLGTRVSTEQWAVNDRFPWFNCPLENGETYYYRVIANLPYNENTDEAFFYGPEMSFRVPNLKADAGYDSGDIYFSDEAWASFMQYFPADMPADKSATWQKVMRSLQQKWEATLENSPYDLTTATKLTFDDGIAYVLPEVPEAFYTWMSTRELVIHASQESEYCSAEINVNNQKEPQTSFEIVSNVDASWDIPSNSYLVCTPAVYEGVTSNISASVYFNLSEAVPGIRYKLTITLAPETRYTPEKDESGNYIGENASHFLPVPIRIDSYSLASTGSNVTPFGILGRRTSVESKYTTAAIAKDVIVHDEEMFDFSCSLLNIQSTPSRSQLNRGTQTNELHIAEVRLTPIPIDE